MSEKAQYPPGPYTHSGAMRGYISVGEGAESRALAQVFLASQTSNLPSETSQREIETLAVLQLFLAAPETAAERDRLKALNEELLENARRFIEIVPPDQNYPALAELRHRTLSAIAKARRE